MSDDDAVELDELEGGAAIDDDGEIKAILELRIKDDVHLIALPAELGLNAAIDVIFGLDLHGYAPAASLAKIIRKRIAESQ